MERLWCVRCEEQQEQLAASHQVRAAVARRCGGQQGQALGGLPSRWCGAGAELTTIRCAAVSGCAVGAGPADGWAMCVSGAGACHGRCPAAELGQEVKQWPMQALEACDAGNGAAWGPDLVDPQLSWIMVMQTMSGRGEAGWTRCGAELEVVRRWRSECGVMAILVPVRRRFGAEQSRGPEAYKRTPRSSSPGLVGKAVRDVRFRGSAHFDVCEELWTTKMHSQQCRAFKAHLQSRVR
ncbi:hypothetical protein Taro_010280 [Colocasia esculenta]|uniref:Uncharacterized protein n=1 Tax=Colocasia esculenta TaxID=4460 RepID=A0A843U2X0_COLES|nr:hypothetical protein [Colocasia esculenta]